MSLKTVTVLTKAKGCVQCDATHRTLARTDILFAEKDATLEENRQIGLDLGHMQAPVVLIHQDGQLIHHWSGNNPIEIDRIKNDPLIERKAPADSHGLAA